MKLYKKDPTNKSYELFGKILLNDFIIYSEKSLFNKKEKEYIFKLFNVNNGILLEENQYTIYEW